MKIGDRVRVNTDHPCHPLGTTGIVTSVGTGGFLDAEQGCTVCPDDPHMAIFTYKRKKVFWIYQERCDILTEDSQ